MTTYSKHGLKRFFFSLILSIIFHGFIFTLFEYFSPFEFKKPIDYTGPLFVTIETQKSLLTPPVEVEKKIIPETPEKQELEHPVQKPEKPLEKTALITESEKTVSTSQKNARVAKPSKTIKSPASSVPYREAPPASPEVKSSSLPRGTVIEEYSITELPGYEEAEETVYSKKLDPEALARRHLPLKGEESKEAPDFKTKVEVEREDSTLDIASLDRVLEKTGEGTGSEKPLSNVSGTPGDTKTVKATTGVAVPEEMDIEWDRSSRERKLLFAPPEPDIPRWVSEQGLDLKVVVRFYVTPEGNTTGVEIERPWGTSGYTDVDASVMEVIRKLKFLPVETTQYATGKITYIVKRKEKRN